MSGWESDIFEPIFKRDFYRQLTAVVKCWESRRKQCWLWKFPGKGRSSRNKFTDTSIKLVKQVLGFAVEVFMDLIKHIPSSRSDVQKLAGKIFQTFEWTIRIFQRNISMKYFKYFKRSNDRCNYCCSNFYVILQTLWVGPSNRVERP